MKILIIPVILLFIILFFSFGDDLQRLYGDDMRNWTDQDRAEYLKMEDYERREFRRELMEEHRVKQIQVGAILFISVAIMLFYGPRFLSEYEVKLKRNISNFQINKQKKKGKSMEEIREYFFEKKHLSNIEIEDLFTDYETHFKKPLLARFFDYLPSISFTGKIRRFIILQIYIRKGMKQGKTKKEIISEIVLKGVRAEYAQPYFDKYEHKEERDKEEDDEDELISE